MIFDWPKGDSQWTAINGSFRLVTINSVSTSPYSGARKSSTLGDVWMARLEFDLRDLPRAKAFQRLITVLRGSENTIRMYDRWRPWPPLLRGEPAPFSDGTFFSDGTGFTDGYSPLAMYDAAHGAKFITVEGLPASKQCFEGGDLIGIGGYLYEISSEIVSSNALGQALVPILPGLRTGVAQGDPISLWYPTVPMLMMSPADAAVERIGRNAGRIELTFIEDIP